MGEKASLHRARAEELSRIAGGTIDDTTRKALYKLVDDYKQLAKAVEMDERAEHYRERAAELRKVADGAPDKTMRKGLLENVAHYEQMALTLDAIAANSPAHPKPH